MRMFAALLLLAAVAWADTSPPRPTNPAIAVERLGNRFTSIGPEDDAGLVVAKYRNDTLEREELWHNTTESSEWFVRVRPGIYVLGVYDAEAAEWKTDPAVRIVLRRGKWERVKLAP